MNRFIKKLILIATVVAIFFLIYQVGVAKYFSLEQLKEHSHVFKDFVSNHYFFGVLLYILFFIVTLLFGLPLVPLFALAAGYLFGIVYGIIYSEMGAVLGAIISFLIYRSFFYQVIQKKYKTKFAKFEHEIKKGGASYLLVLQFLGVVPFFVINAVAILAGLPLKTMVWTTALGTLPFLVIYVVAGSKLRTINSMQDLLSWQALGMLFIFALLALVPLIIKRMKKNYHI